MFMDGLVSSSGTQVRGDYDDGPDHGRELVLRRKKIGFLSVAHRPTVIQYHTKVWLGRDILPAYIMIEEKQRFAPSDKESDQMFQNFQQLNSHVLHQLSLL